MDITKSQDVATATITRGAGEASAMEVHGSYVAQCFGPDGQLKWEEKFDNLVTTEGKDFLLNTVFIGGAGTGALASVNMFYRMAFVATNTTALATMTYAVPTYTEATSGVIAARGSPAFSASSAGVKATSAAVSAAIVGSATIYGVAIVVLNAAAVGNLGVVADTATANAKLYSYGLFGAGKVVNNLDTLNVTYSTTLT